MPILLGVSSSKAQNFQCPIIPLVLTDVLAGLRLPSSKGIYLLSNWVLYAPNLWFYWFRVKIRNNATLGHVWSFQLRSYGSPPYFLDIQRWFEDSVVRDLRECCFYQLSFFLFFFLWYYGPSIPFNYRVLFPSVLYQPGFGCLLQKN